MSRDKKSKEETSKDEIEAKPVLNHEAIVEKLPHTSTVDAVESNSTSPERVRRKSRNQGEKGPLAGYDRYIPKGWRGRFVNPAKNRPQVLYNRDYEFVLDENGNKIWVPMNSAGAAAEIKYVLMMIREEDIAESARERLEEQKERLNAESDKYTRNARGQFSPGTFIGRADDNFD